MNIRLSEVLKHIGDEYRDKISDRPGTRNYLEVDIGKRAEEMGFSDISEKYRAVNAMVPLKNEMPGMKVRIDGRTFVNYARYTSGMIVPGYVATDTGLPYEPYVANDCMILSS